MNLLGQTTLRNSGVKARQPMVFSGAWSWYPRAATAGGVRVVNIAEDPEELMLLYDPTHPDANEDGYVEMPNVDMVKEMTDAMAAAQAYSANVTAFNTLKTVIAQGLEIGK